MLTRIPTYRLFILLGLCAFVFSACKNRKQTVTSYKYLITKDQDEKDSEPDNSSTTSSTNTTTTHTVNKSAQTVIREAEGYLGTPYRYGGIGKNGIDCSGLTQKAYRVAGVSLGRSALDQSKQGALVKRKDLQPGDLVFFSAKNNGRIDHVGMVTTVKGEDVTFIHASSSKGVRHDKLNVGYWRNLFKHGRRMKL